MRSSDEGHQAAHPIPYTRMEPLQYQAMIAEITNTIRRELHFINPPNEFPPDVEPNAGRPMRGGRRGRGGHGSEGGSLAEEDHRPYHRRPRDNNNLGILKLRIPPFSGKDDPDAYLEWEEEMEMVFNYQHYTEAKKIKLATSGFSGHAIHWWDQIAFTRRRNGEPQITSWFEMKIVMKKRFAPDYNQFGYVQDSPHQRRSQERNIRSRSTKDKAVTKAVRNSQKESNNGKQKEDSETSSSPNGAAVSRRLFGTEKLSNDPITGKCFLPSSQMDYVLKSKEICRELTFFEPASPSSLVFSPQDFEEDTPEEVPKKVPPARNKESSSDDRDVFKTRGGEEKPDPLPNLLTSEKSLAEGELMVKENLCEFDKDPFSVSSVSVLDETCISFTNLTPVQPSIREFSLQDQAENLLKQTTRRSPVENRLKLCKNIGVPSSLPSLFMVVTPEEEKQFGLENVKEFCVSGFAFDEMNQSFEAPKYETFSRPKCSLFAENCDSEFAMSHKLIRRTLGQKLFEIDADLMIDECFSTKVLHNSNLVRKGCENLCFEDFWVLKPCEMNSALNENVFRNFSKLENDFAWFGRVLSMSRTNCAWIEFWFSNMRDLLRAKRMSEFEYVEKASKLAQSNLFASNCIYLFGLCSKEKLCSSECSNARMIYDLILDGDLRNLNLVFKVLNLENSFVYFCCTFDMVFLVFEKKQDRQVMEFVPRTRRIQGLDQQVDYGPKEYLFVPTWQPPSTLQGEEIFDHTSNVFNLFSCVADELDLRSNPFKGGGDGAILERLEEKDKQPISDEEQCLQRKPDKDKKSVDLCNEPELELDQMQPMDVELGWKEGESDTAQEEKAHDVFESPLAQSRAKTQRKPILQVVWACLRRKRKKPRRVKQLGLIKCFRFCKEA